VNFPDFPEGWSQGEDHQEALAQAADLLGTMVANHMAEGWDLPDPSPARGWPPVRLAPLVAAKAAPAAVDRLFSIYRKTRLDQIEAALAALGRRLVVSVESV
jgi:antitoxin HicB